MASEIRVDKINSLSGVGTVTLSPTGVDIAGITTAATLRATTGIVTSLTAGSLTSLGAVSGTTGTFTSNVSIEGNTTLGNATSDTITFTGTVSSDLSPNGSTRDLGTSGSEWRNLYTANGVIASDDIAVHASDTNTKIRFPAADTITAETNGNERLRLNSSGQLFSGATSTDHANRTFVTSRDSGNYISIITDANDNCGITFGDSTNGTGNYETYIAHANSTNDFTIYTAQGAKSFAFKSGGDLSISDGNLIFASGHGIDFSATGNPSGMTSELFDDYEEGTWTPTIVAGSPTPTINTIASARYTKVGRLVTVQTYFSANNTSSNTDNLIIGGLPFTSANASQYYYGSGRLGVQDRCVPQVNANSNQVSIYNTGGSNHNVNAIINTYLLFSVTYEAT